MKILNRCLLCTARGTKLLTDLWLPRMQNMTSWDCGVSAGDARFSES
jgi:hypothetical protein